MSERNEFERDVREALRAEAEAGPDYRATLHARVMERVLAASAAPPVPTVSPPVPPPPHGHDGAGRGHRSAGGAGALRADARALTFA